MQSDVRSGKIAFIDEILSQKKDGASFRVTGRLVKYDASSRVAVISEGKGKRELSIKTDLLKEFPFKIDSLFQFIGEFNANGGFVRARVARNVDGLDMKLYAEALKLCREAKKMPS